MARKKRGRRKGLIPPGRGVRWKVGEGEGGAGFSPWVAGKDGRMAEMSYAWFSSFASIQVKERYDTLV